MYKLHYPSGDVVTYEPGTAGLTLSAKDTSNNINYVTSATYGPDSALTGFISGYSGTFAGITSAFSYNKRLQPVNMSASAPSQTVFSIGYSPENIYQACGHLAVCPTIILVETRGDAGQQEGKVFSCSKIVPPLTFPMVPILPKRKK